MRLREVDERTTYMQHPREELVHSCSSSPAPWRRASTTPLIYASIAGGFAVAYPFAFLANRYMIARGKGHALVHEHHGEQHHAH